MKLFHGSNMEIDKVDLSKHMTNQQQEMIEYTIQEVVKYLVEDSGITMEQAMEQFYLSGVFEILTDIKTGLYLEGSAYIYEMLKRELQKGIGVGHVMGR